MNQNPSTENLCNEIYELAFSKLGPVSMRLTERIGALIEKADDLIHTVRFPETGGLTKTQVHSRLLKVKRELSQLLENMASITK